MAYIVNLLMGNGKLHVYWVINHQVKGATPERSRQYLGPLDKATMELILGLNTPEPNAKLSQYRGACFYRFISIVLYKTIEIKLRKGSAEN